MKTPDMIKFLDDSALSEAYMPPKPFAAYVHEQDRITQDWIDLRLCSRINYPASYFIKTQNIFGIKSAPQHRGDRR